MLEAMSYGNCCLASDIPENVEALHGHGYAFKNKDEDDLFRKLSYLTKNPEAVNLVKDNAQEHVLENYTWDMVASQYEALYNKVLYS